MAESESVPTPTPVIDRELILHYLDKVYQSQQRLWDSANRILLTQTILSLLVIGLSVGVLSVDEQFELSGLKFKIALWVILGGGAGLIAILLISYYTLEAYAQLLGESVSQRYSELGAGELLRFPTDVIDSNPNVLMASISFFLDMEKPNKFQFMLFIDNFVTVLAVFLLLLVLPLAAEICAGLRISSHFNWKWWAWLPFVVILSFSVLSFITFVMRVTSSKD